MDLQINNQSKSYPVHSLSIQELLNIERPLSQQGIAVAIDHQVIPKQRWPTYFLKQGNAILIITASQGG